jgi:hypothetical protein
VLVAHVWFIGRELDLGRRPSRWSSEKGSGVPEGLLSALPLIPGARPVDKELAVAPVVAFRKVVPPPPVAAGVLDTDGGAGLTGDGLSCFFISLMDFGRPNTLLSSPPMSLRSAPRASLLLLAPPVAERIVPQ